MSAPPTAREYLPSPLTTYGACSVCFGTDYSLFIYLQAMLPRKNQKILAIVLGIVIGFTIAQMFYMDSNGWSQLFPMSRVKYLIYREETLKETKDLLASLDIDCDCMWKHKNESKMAELKKWKFDYEMLELEILYANDTCAALHQYFSFPSSPNSEEEANYPLAYGLLVYKNFAQVMFMLSSFYQPQHSFCIAVSGSASKEFKFLISATEKCLPNVKVMFRPPIEWGSFEIINSLYKCMEYLSGLKNDWKYFQYLSGFDVPLKTNLEMVKIFKSLNESINIELIDYQQGRYKDRKEKDAPLKLYKSSMSALIPRPAANFLAKANKTKDLMEFLSKTSIPDEALWGTIGGNRKVFPVPGSLDADSFLTFKRLFSKIDSISKQKSHFGYYISRYQIWSGQKSCRGHWKAASCVFGVGDYADLIQQPHLVAHKMYLESEPAAYFCVLKEIRNRTANAVTFDSTPYSELPQVELKKGVPYKQLKHKDWMLHLNGEL